MSGQAFPHPLYRPVVLEPAYADASAYLFGPMLAANRAQVRRLAKQRIITPGCADSKLAALDQIEEFLIRIFGVGGTDDNQILPGNRTGEGVVGLAIGEAGNDFAFSGRQLVQQGPCFHFKKAQALTV